MHFTEKGKRNFSMRLFQHPLREEEYILCFKKKRNAISENTRKVPESDAVSKQNL